MLFPLVSTKHLFNVTHPQAYSLQMQFHLEVGHLCYYYYESTLAQHHFCVAEKLSQLSVEMTGWIFHKYCFAIIHGYSCGVKLVLLVCVN